MPTLHRQFLASICGCHIVESEYVTCELTLSSQFDDAITEERCYLGFIRESESRSATCTVEEFHPLINELAKAYNISTAVNCLYYYPRFGFYNCLIDVFFLQDY